jgi:hypothetical protein
METNNGTAAQPSGDVTPAVSTATPAQPVRGSNQPLSGEESQMAEMILSDLAKKLMSPETADISLQESIGRRLADFEIDRLEPRGAAI